MVNTIYSIITWSDFNLFNEQNTFTIFSEKLSAIGTLIFSLFPMNVMQSHKFLL